MKTCLHCGEEKPLSAFYKRNTSTEERVRVCKACWVDGRRHPSRTAGVAVKAWHKANPEAARAHSLLKQAVLSGRIDRGKCVVCKKLGADGHHPDYSKPLEVTWLCRRHHQWVHGRMELPVADCRRVSP